jgi:hypothetical protein
VKLTVILPAGHTPSTGRIPMLQANYSAWVRSWNQTALSVLHEVLGAYQITDPIMVHKLLRRDTE